MRAKNLKGKSQDTQDSLKSPVRSNLAVTRVVGAGMFRTIHVVEVLPEGENTLHACPKARIDRKVAVDDCVQQNCSCHRQIHHSVVMGRGGYLGYCTLPFWLAAQARHRHSMSGRPPRKFACCLIEVLSMFRGRAPVVC